ncbi:MAG: glycosyltransferase family 9 protein [Arsenophonus sp. NC-WZS1-MAG3]
MSHLTAALSKPNITLYGPTPCSKLPK